MRNAWAKAHTTYRSILIATIFWQNEETGHDMPAILPMIRL